MPTHSEQQILPYDTQQLFDLVADIERYPEFLPWCRTARILEREDGAFLGELIISFAHMSERYTSRVTLTRPLKPSDAGEIDVTMVKGPFKHLVNRWRFTPCPGGTQVDFFIDFQFRSLLMEKLIGSLFAGAAARMVGAFKSQAEALYGSRK